MTFDDWSLSGQLLDVDSAFIQAIRYDYDEETLYVSMKGVEYTYDGINLDIAKAFFNAESKGRFYMQHIKGTR
jgi:YD repeat-containing protein